ncbi:MAG: hypothetical protein ABEH81_09830 [Halopenitus sp.]
MATSTATATSADSPVAGAVAVADAGAVAVADAGAVAVDLAVEVVGYVAFVSHGRPIL